MAETIFSHFGTFIMVIIMTLFPTAGFELPCMTTVEENCDLNVAMISDIHLETPGVFRKGFTKQALRRINNAKDPIDVITVSGDLTNYGDEESLAAYYELISEYTDIPVITAAGNHDIGHVGDRDKTNISREEALANVIKYRNQYFKTDIDTNYYSYEVKGYKFIVLGDEVIDGGHWDAISMTQEQLDFLDKELAKGTKNGKPCFVVSHWPVDHSVSEDFIWDGSSIEETEYDIRPILEKYKNVVYISGHMHSGFKSQLVEEVYGLKNAEKVNGVVYISLPSFGIVNTFGLPLSGYGATLEVYGGKVIFRPINYLTGNWLSNCKYEFTLD